MTHRRWRGPVNLARDRRNVIEEPRLRGLLHPILFDDVARRLVVSGLPEGVGGALLLAVLPSHLAEVGGRRLAARVVGALKAGATATEFPQGS